GSFYSKNMADYYVTPFEMGYGRTISFEHEFIGREALQQMRDNGEAERRQKVTLIWNKEDVAAVYKSFFEDDLPGKIMQQPLARYATFQYDTVSNESGDIGFSGWPQFSAIHRELLSLAIVDADQAEIGTEVSVTWGE